MKFEGTAASKNWTKRVARLRDIEAKEYFEEEFKGKCNQEECVGEACIELIN